MMMAEDEGTLVTLNEPQIKFEDALSTDYDHGEDEIDTDPLCPSELSELHQPVDPIHPLNQLRFVKTNPGPLDKSDKVLQPKPVLLLVGLPRSNLPLTTTNRGGQVQRFFETPIQKNPGVVRPRAILAKINLGEKKSAQPPVPATGATASPPVSSKPTPPPPTAPKSPAAESPSRARMASSGRKRRPLLPNYTLEDGPPHNEGSAGPSCECVPCMRTYFEKLRLKAPARSERERDAYRKRLRQGKASGPSHDEERSTRAGAIRARFYRKIETPEERERRLAINRVRKCEREKTMSPERRAIMLAKKREQKQRAREALSEEKRAIMLAKKREQKQRAREALSEEKRAIMLAKKREQKQRAREAITPEEREILLAQGRERERRARAEKRREALLSNECEEELQQDVPVRIEMGEEVKEEEVQDEDPYEEDIEEAEETGQLSPRSGSQMRRRPKCTIETLRLEVQRRNTLSKVRRLAATPEQRERRRELHRRAYAKRALEKEKLGFCVPRQHLTIDQKIEQIAALEEAMKREEEEEKKFIDSFKYDDEDGQVSCTVCSVLVLKQDMGYHMKYHAEQQKKKT